MQNIKTIIILILVALLILQRECQRCPEAIETHTTDTIPGDAVPVLVPIDRPIPQFVYVDTGSWNYFPIDTMAIIKDYFSKAVYFNVLKDDSSAYIAVYDTVHMNRLQGRSLLFANRRPTAINHYTTIQHTDERMKLYAGAMFALSKKQEPEFGPALILITPKGYGYSYAYGLNHQTHTFSLVWKIKLKR